MLRLREFAGIALLMSVVSGGAVVYKLEPGRFAFLHQAVAPAVAAPVHVAQALMHPTAAPATVVAAQPAPAPTAHLNAAPPIPTPATSSEADSDGDENETAPPAPLALSDQDVALVAARLSSKVPEALLKYFDLYLYVSKAAEGSWAQHMFVFHKGDNDAFVYEENFPVSTGRELQEKYFTATPSGLFELDPDRFEPMHISHRWDGARMPWSMFLNYQVRDRMAGIALHAAVGAREDADLGHRASGGCVRLPLDRAGALYHRIESEEEGDVPVFDFNALRGTTDVAGATLTDSIGSAVTRRGYKVLLVIDPYPGPAGAPAAVSQIILRDPALVRLALAWINRKTAPRWDKMACLG